MKKIGYQELLHLCKDINFKLGGVDEHGVQILGQSEDGELRAHVVFSYWLAKDTELDIGRDDEISLDTEPVPTYAFVRKGAIRENEVYLFEH